MYNNRYIDYRSHWLINFEEELKVFISKLGGEAGAGCGECGGEECEEKEFQTSKLPEDVKVWSGTACAGPVNTLVN